MRLWIHERVSTDGGCYGQPRRIYTTEAHAIADMEARLGRPADFGTVWLDKRYSRESYDEGWWEGWEITVWPTAD